MHRYPAKLLLFGEHILLLGAPAVAVPLPTFGGDWAWGDSVPSVSSLRDFMESPALSALQEIDTVGFRQEVEAGIFFDSNIPMGYGLGSSGALCAAVYDRYAREKATLLRRPEGCFCPDGKLLSR